MLTVTLTPHDPPTHKDRAESMGVMTGASALDMECPTRAGRAPGGVAWVGPQKNGGWGTPVLCGTICPPTPFSTPRVRKFPFLPLTAPHRHFMSQTKDTRSPTNKTPPTPLHGSAMMTCGQRHPPMIDKNISQSGKGKNE